MSDLWSALVSAIDSDFDAMPAVLQSTINLLETELIKARAALQEIQPAPILRIGDEVAVGAMIAYRQNLISRAPDFYGSRRLTAKELGLEPIIREIPQKITPNVISMPEPTPSPRRAPIEEALTNSLILDHVAPYLAAPSLLALASTSRLMYSMITQTPYIFRHLDLTRCRGAQLPKKSQRQDDLQTEDEVYSAPLRCIFASLEKRSVLQDVRTLVLDGLPVPANLVADIILTDRFNVSILSIRECLHLNERKLMQVIQHAVRPTRPEGTPRIKGIYHFSPRTKAPRGVVRRRYRDWWGSRIGSRSPSQSSSSSSSSASSDDEEDVPRTPAEQNEWYSSSGRLFKHTLDEGWAQTLQKCEGIIAFDAVLCRGPRHDVNLYSADEGKMAPEAPMLGPAVATVALVRPRTASCRRALQAVPPNPRVHTTSFDPFNPHTFAAESRARQQVENRQHQLPHPLTFRVVNPQNGRFVYAGIREFSAAENEVALSALLRESLGIEDTEFESHANGVTQDSDNREAQEQSSSSPAVTVHAKQLPKGTYVRLRPLEAGYDPEDWKALLERHLRDNFTTLTVNEILNVPGTRNEAFRFLVDKVYPEGDGICVVDTDLEVDIVALSEEQARETLRKRLERAARAPGTTSGSSVGGVLALGEAVTAQVLPGEYVDYELREWNREDTLEVELVTEDPNLCLFVSPLGARQQSRPRADMHVWGDFSSQSLKRVKIRSTNVALEGAEALYISAHANSIDSDAAPTQQSPAQYHLRIAANELEGETETEEAHEPGDVQCQNCRQWVPQRTLILHENFCLRNNVLCSQCNNVFQKRSPEWENHWHCPHDSAHGNDASSKLSHDSIFHSAHSCPDCAAQFEGLPALAQHRTTECPGKLILCQFCHLLVPQKGEADPDLNDPEVMLSGLTPHELSDGGRTTECHLCNKIIRLRDMKTHLRHHDLERVSRPAPRICLNQNCGRTLSSASNTSLGLCSICYGPLYVDTYDPEGKALRRRIERRYLSQMMTGCGKPWCQNEYCKTGKQNSRSADSPTPVGVADIIKITRPLVDAINFKPEMPNSSPLYFCTDETGQIRRNLAEMLSAEGSDGKSYALEWCVAGAEASGGDLEKTREWLAKWAPTQSETSR
ncbi:hypothetical protein N7451_001454 [Penicillium sp. IBT 35674x]|nr:hypothetical protein N7451_001454 [Penicillium sp. IBT 35674x]